LYTKESGGSWSWFRQLAFPKLERSDRAIDRLTELSNIQVRVFELSEATRPALGGLFTTLSWHDEVSAKGLWLDVTCQAYLSNQCQNVASFWEIVRSPFKSCSGRGQNSGENSSELREGFPLFSVAREDAWPPSRPWCPARTGNAKREAPSFVRVCGAMASSRQVSQTLGNKISVDEPAKPHQ
jgi:hypothetical protein